MAHKGSINGTDIEKNKESPVLFKSFTLVNVRSVTVINERVVSKCTRGCWSSIGVWNTILTSQSLFKNRAACPAWSCFAQGLLRERVPSTPPWAAPAFPTAMGDGAGSPALSPAQMTCSQPHMNYPHGSHLRGVPCGLCGVWAALPCWQGPCWRRLPETPGRTGCTYRAAITVSEKLVLKPVWLYVGVIEVACTS